MKKELLVIIFVALTLPSCSVQQNASKISDLPRNPQPGHCYVRCAENNSTKLKWKDIDCALVAFQKLDVLLQGDVLSKRDEKILEQTFRKFIEEGYRLQLDSHYTSVGSIEDNIIQSRERGITLANYLVGLGYSSDLIIVNALGSGQKKTGFYYRVVNVS